MIEAFSLTKRYGDATAASGVSFMAKPGEVVGFLGPNGAGKTTTLRMIAGFLPPTSGTARICGHDVGGNRLHAQARLGYLPDGAPAWPDMTPLGLLRFAAEARGITGVERDRKAEAALERLDLRQVRLQPIETLSKGFKRRVGFAQAILHDPEVLLMDEPTDGLDPNQKHEVRKLIRTLAADRTILLSTHILEEVPAVCSRVIVIAGGRLVADALPADLAAKHGGLEEAFRALTLPAPENAANRKEAA